MNPFRRRLAAPSDLPTLDSPRAHALFLDERGAATAEYAIATMGRHPVLTGPWSLHRGRRESASDSSPRCSTTEPTTADPRPPR